ncbi:MAG TPA: glycosyl transferase family 2 [Methylomirabilota bacterium]|nr:glycosyl transferase family 2 [Methylomirabilota bacterium]
MSDILPLPDAVESKLSEIGKADLLVGIPSYNNARTIGHVVRAASAGLTKYFRDARAVIVNSDGGSTDQTQEIVAQADVPELSTILVSHGSPLIAKILTPYHGIPGKGSAFRAIFQIADRLGVRAACVVDADLRSIRPDWFELLLGPVVEGHADYVAPLYQRHKFDGTITNSIVYPLTRALYGKRVRQPIGGEFGFSGDLARLFLAKPVWETDVARFGIDIWMTTTALAEGHRVCQAYLGAKLHDAKDPGGDLTQMMTQVVGSCFDLVECYESIWAGVHGSEPVPLFGFPHAVGVEPVPVNAERMLSIFRQGLTALEELWATVLSQSLRAELREAAGAPVQRVRVTDPVWTEVVYRFAVAHHRRSIPREHLLGSLVPLYLGRTASFVLEMWEAGAQEVEERVERLARSFEEMKPLLVSEWRTL